MAMHLAGAEGEAVPRRVDATKRSLAAATQAAGLPEQRESRWPSRGFSLSLLRSHGGAARGASAGVRFIAGHEKK